MSALKSNAIIQIGIVVKDIEHAASQYSKLFGIEMPNIRDAFPHVTYRGKKITAKAKLCSFAMGNITLELVQPEDSDSSWKEFLKKKGEGVHHLGIMVSDAKEALKGLSENGIEMIQQGGASWGSYTIVDSEDSLGVRYNIKCDQPWSEE